MIISLNELCSTECTVTDIVAHHHIWDAPTQYNYETNGRINNLLYYQLDNNIDYFANEKKIVTLNKHDIIFIPTKFKYTSVVDESKEKPTSGIGITFNLRDTNGEIIEFSDDIKLVTKDENEQFYQSFKKLLFSFHHPTINSLKLKAQIYFLLDELFKDKDKNMAAKKIREDIFNAITIIENNPQKNYTNKHLAELCFMSESSFMRKFKAYSGGITPLQYRNSIRLTRAADLIYTTKTLDEIAELLGFYDAAHLCRIYKQTTGHTLKKRQ